MDYQVAQTHTPRRNTARMAVRPDTSDAPLVGGIMDQDEYGLRHAYFEGTALDIGAHIGCVTVALALDNPGLRVVAVEALPENAALLRESVAMNGLQDQVVVIEAAATDDKTKHVGVTYGWSHAPNMPENYIVGNRFIGGMVPANDSSTTLRCPGIGLAELTRQYGPFSFLKIDCEGCEWRFLASPAVRDVPRIIGEYHNGRRISGIRKLLAGFDVTHRSGDDVGLFDAVAA